MKTIKITAALFAMLLAVSGLGAQDDTAGKPDNGLWDARVYNISGDVFIKRGGTAKKWVPLRSAVPLDAEDLIRTGKKAGADISLNDRGIISLGESTIIELKTLRRKDASFILEVGRFVAKITGLKERAERMKVRTPTMVAAVRGTEFSVKYGADLGETAISIFDEGEIQVNSLDKSGASIGKGVMLRPHQEVLVKKERPELTPYKITDTESGGYGIINSRKKLETLIKYYQPVDERRRLKLRENIFGSESGSAKFGRNNGSAREDGETADSAQGGSAPKKSAGAAGNAKFGATETSGRTNSSADSGQDNIPRLKTATSMPSMTGTLNTTGTGGDAPRAMTRQDKEVDTAALSLKSRLSRSGNGDVLSQDELRALVKLGIKNSDSNLAFDNRVKLALDAKKRRTTRGSGANSTGSSLPSKGSNDTSAGPGGSRLTHP